MKERKKYMYEMSRPVFRVGFSSNSEASSLYMLKCWFSGLLCRRVVRFEFVGIVVHINTSCGVLCSLSRCTLFREVAQAIVVYKC